MKLLWLVLMMILAAREVWEFLRMRREHVQIFESAREMVLVALLTAVVLAGIFVKSREKRN